MNLDTAVMSIPLRRCISLTAVAVIALSGTGCSREALPAVYSFDTTDLDGSVNPCTNFDDFVNSKWRNATPIPPDVARVGILDEMQNRADETTKRIAEDAANRLGSLKVDSDEWKIGALYASAMDESAINRRGFDPVKPTLAKIDAIAARQDLTAFILDDATGNDTTLLGLGAEPDPTDASTMIASVSDFGLGLPNSGYYIDDPANAPALAGYTDYLRVLLTLTGVPDAAASVQAGQAIGFEKSMVAATLTPEALVDAARIRRVVTVAEANQLTPAFDWRRYFDAQNLRSVDSFMLSDTAFFHGVNDLLASAPVEQWKSYLRTHVLIRFAGRLSSGFRDASFQLSQLLNGTAKAPPRWKLALESVNTEMPDALGRLYVQRTFSAKDKERALTLVGELSNALAARIQSVGWMSAPTKLSALDKRAAIVAKVGYPDKWRDYSGLGIEPGDYFGNLVRAAKFDKDAQLDMIGKPTDRTRWTASPQTVNAFYGGSNNTITIPAAILQPPLFDPNADPAINYGGIGSIIGHELTHAFDNNGRQRDRDGSPVDWWTPEDAKQFQARADKLVTQYDHYALVPGRPDVHGGSRGSFTFGVLTESENIADLGGVLVASDALQRTAEESSSGTIDGYTPSQRFFLAYARTKRSNTREEFLIAQVSGDPHAPDNLRVNGVVANVPNFGEAFGCKPQDPMVNDGEKLVSIW